MTVKSEAPSQTAGTIESPLLNTSSPVCWRDRWWLLDVETSGLDRQEDDIIALRLACMEHYSVIQELEILIHPRRPLSPWAEGLTGISNQTLEQAVSLDAAIDDLEGLDGPLFAKRLFALRTGICSSLPSAGSSCRTSAGLFS